MEKRIVLLALVFIVVGFCGSTVLALPPMGPPKALIGHDRWAVGFEYAHWKMDLEAYGRAQENPWGLDWLDPAYAKHKIEDLTSNMFFGSLSYGVSDNWDVFVRLGASDAQDDMTECRIDGSTPNEYRGLDCSYGFAWGFGTRATFWQDGDLSWGGLFQITWENPDDGSISFRSSDPDRPVLKGDAELDLRQIQIATGPTLQLDGLCIYGGPFLNFVKGDIDINASGVVDPLLPDLISRVRLSHDVREESQIGGYAGIRWETTKEASLYAECQLTDDAWGIGIGAIYRFK